MEGDVFISNHSNNKVESVENNFFLSPFDLSSENITQDSGKRLNDYDYNILKEEAYKDITDELLKLEYKISKAEEDLRNLDSQIEAASAINDLNTVYTLNSRKDILKLDLEHLMEIYNDKSLAAKISGGLTGIIKNKINERFSGLKKSLEVAQKMFLNKMPQRFAKTIQLKKSLSKLESINKSVDELMSMQIPYGEAYDKYEQLSKYIVKANSIQAEISKHIR